MQFFHSRRPQQVPVMLAVAAVLWLAPATTRAQNLLVNPSFENGQVTFSNPGLAVTPFVGWTVGGTGIVSDNGVEGASNGTGAALFGGGTALTGSTLSQAVARVII